jgi:hypothetical protein
MGQQERDRFCKEKLQQTASDRAIAIDRSSFTSIPEQLFLTLQEES